MSPLLPLALMLSSPAAGQALSRDISMHPISAAATTTGPIQTVRTARPGSVQAGWTVDVSHRPMDQYRCADAAGTDCNEVAAVVIGQRVTGVVSGAVAVSRRTWLELDVPAIGQWNGTAEGLSPQGVVAGDPRIGVRSRLFDRTATVDAYASLTAPIGAKGQWFGESLPTSLVGATIGLSSGPVTGLVDVGGWLRAAPAKNDWDFDLGSAILTRAALSVDVAEPVAVYTALTLRASANGAASVAWAGATADFSSVLRADVGIGRAIVTGPGAAPLHARIGFTFTHVRPEPAPVVVVDTPVVDPSAWPDGVTFRLRNDQLELREPLAFLRADARVAPESYRTLRDLAAWLDNHPDTGHVLVAAYAHTASSSAANYTLSLTRAQTLVDHLVLAGVPRSRLSYKGMGMLGPDAEAGEHTVVVDGQPQEHITLVVQELSSPVAGTDPEPFAEWLARQEAP